MALLITRKKLEKIGIVTQGSETISITIVEIKKWQVKIMINAGKETHIFRADKDGFLETRKTSIKKIVKSLKKRENEL